MRTIGVAVALFALAACSKKDEAPAVDTTTVVPVPAAPATLTVADLTGTWEVEVRNEAGDSVLTTYVLTAPADTSKWSMQFTGRKDAIPTQLVAVAGDSAVVHTGPYSSALRKDIKVTTDVVYRLVDGKLVGKAVAHYNVKTADSVRMLNISGTKR
jgi:hypothetical protein